MSCCGTNKRVVDFSYVKALAVAFCKINEYDVDIFEREYPIPINKGYDFEIAKEGRVGVIETIRFSDYSGKSILSDIGGTELGTIEKATVETKPKSTRRKVSVDSGSVLPENK